MHQLQFSQKLPISLKEAWEFFSSPQNLAKITPRDLDFEITHHHEQKKMYQGQIIAYTIRPVLGIKMRWVTEILAVKELEYFIDEQRFGPYKFWHHEHWFKEIPNGVLMEDLLYYELPMGILGRAVNAIKVRRDVEQIFSHRELILQEMFGSYKA